MQINSKFEQGQVFLMKDGSYKLISKVVNGVISTKPLSSNKHKRFLQVLFWFLFWIFKAYFIVIIFFINSYIWWKQGSPQMATILLAFCVMYSYLERILSKLDNK